jgi:hypothetical protein
MEQTADGVHLALFGGPSWRRGNRLDPLPAGLPTSIAVALAESRRGFVRAETLVEELWAHPPSSGLNALQRHVSRLRSHLRSAGIDPATVLESTGTAYRLAPTVRTDLDLIRTDNGAGEITGPATGAAPCWWLEPLVGLPWEQHRVTRVSMASAASRMCQRWAEQAIAEGRAHDVVAVLDRYVRIHPHDLPAWSLFVAAAVSTGDRQLAHTVEASAAAARQELGLGLADRDGRSPGAPRTTAGAHSRDAITYGSLSRSGSLWMGGDVDGALEALEAVADDLTPDLVRRFTRCLIWIPHEDDFARAVWADWTAVAATWPESSERVFVTFDAYALEQMTDALDVADHDVESAASVPELVRALRVRFMVGLGHPITTQQRQVVARLAAIDDADAEVESARFEALLAIKSGRVVDAVEGLDRYADVVRRRWPPGSDDFQNLALAVLSLSVGAEVPLDGELAARLKPVIANELTVDMATLWNRLDRRDDLDSQVARFRLRRLMATVPPDCAAAYELYFRLRTEGAAPTQAAALELAADIETRPRQRLRHAAIVALGRWAVEAGDHAMAARVLELVLPWEGEYLGLWPCDTVIGPAEELIEALRAV